MKNNYWSATFDTPEEAVKAAEDYAQENGDVEFDGMNCNEWLEEDQIECSGWDGFDRRCTCGNRRVYWEVQKNSDGKYFANATAY
jgi:hypothetical protein